MKTFAIGDRICWKALKGTVIAIVGHVKDISKQVIVRIKWDDEIISSLDAQQRGLKVIKNDEVAADRPEARPEQPPTAN